MSTYHSSSLPSAHIIESQRTRECSMGTRVGEFDGAKENCGDCCAGNSTIRCPATENTYTPLTTRTFGSDLTNSVSVRMRENENVKRTMVSHFAAFNPNVLQKESLIKQAVRAPTVPVHVLTSQKAKAARLMLAAEKEAKKRAVEDEKKRKAAAKAADRAMKAERAMLVRAEKLELRAKKQQAKIEAQAEKKRARLAKEALEKAKKRSNVALFDSSEDEVDIIEVSLSDFME